MNPAPTPRTDIFVNDHLSMWPNWDWQDHASVFANWARDLERELAAKDAEIAQLDNENDRLCQANKDFENDWPKLVHERDQLRAEVERLNRPWTVSIIVPTKNDPFNRHRCEVVDIGHADRHLVVECSELRADLAAAEKAQP